MALEGKYNVVRRKENRYPTYVSVENSQSVTTTNRQSTGWGWMRPLIDEINILRETDKLPEPYKSLPEFIDDTYT